MPRAPRIDAPGLFHHVVVRGVERRAVFVDDDDRRDFLARLDRILPESAMPCLAWVLIPNHVHLLVRTVSVSISRVMARLGTGYARRFNERHGRVGHLFQNRFLSRVIEDEADLCGVVRYIHLNPVKHGLVGSLADLAAYPWCGHRALLGAEEPRPFHDVALALGAFDAEPVRARAALVAGLREGERALGEQVALAGPRAWAPASHERANPPLAVLIDAVADELSVGRRELREGGRAKPVVRARAIVAYRAHVGCGIAVAELAAALRVSETAVRRALEGERRRVGELRAPSSLSPTVPNAGTSPNGGQ